VARTFRGGPVAGGSTITQQTARNLFLDPERTLRRKAREAALATRLESGLSKRRILELYLNVIEWGDGVWGAEAASRHHFGKAAAGLDAFEASFLASLVAAPLSPLSGPNAERARALQLRVLDQLYLSGLLDDAGWRAAAIRTELLHEELAGGVPLPAALAPRPVPDYDYSPPLRDDSSRLPASRALAEECGLARELSSTRNPGSPAP
ncbi:MAG TPA: biosynthetic peptidoglycan transglycosylase, partial [Longimicrobiaceae bacterium]